MLHDSDIIVEDNKSCTPCKKTKKPASSKYYCTDCEAYFCESCFEFHNRIPFLEKHIVLQGTDIKIWADLPYKCKTHAKNYEFFCGEHDSLCCHICVSLQHRSCSDLEYIPEKCKNICTKPEFTDLKRNIIQEIEEVELRKSAFEEKTQMNRHSKETFIKALREQRQMINGLFDSLEKKTLEYMHKTFSENQTYIAKANQQITHEEKNLRMLKQYIDTATPEKDVLVFISLKHGVKLLADIKQKLCKLQESTAVDNFQLVVHPEIERFLQNIPDLGYLETEQMRLESASDEYQRAEQRASKRKFKICSGCGRQLNASDRSCNFCSIKLDGSTPI